MRPHHVLGAFVLVGALSACGSTKSGGTSYQDVSRAVDPQTQPIQVSIKSDETRAASAEIGPDGGSLSAVGADGTRFTLDIPAKALVETVEVSMTPLTSMDGLPWKSGPIEAVQLQPDGQTFYDSVTLTIQPAADFPADQVIPVGATGADHDVYMPLLDPKSKGLVLRLGHFSSAGATKGFLADIEPWRQRLGGDVEARLSSVINAELNRVALEIRAGNANADVEPGFWDWAFSTYKKYVLEPRLAAAGESCAAGQLALRTLMDFERQMEEFGHSVPLDASWADLLPKVSRVCVQEEYELCRDEHVIHRMIPIMLGLARQNEMMGVYEAPQDASAQANAMASVEAEGWDLTRKCLHFELRFESTEYMSTADGSYTSVVEATVPIELGDTTLAPQLTGSAELMNTDFTFKPNRCSAQSIPGGGTFNVVSLTWTDAPPDAGRPYGHVTAIHLTYDPGNTSEVAVVSCPSNPPLRMAFPFWSMGYGAIHANNGEVSGGAQGASGVPDIGSLLGSMGINNLPNVPGLPTLPGLPGSGGSPQPGSDQSSQGSGMTFLAKEWAVRGGDLFAQKEWDLSVNLTTQGTEQGSFKLYHRPQ